jgi:N utilization substance protein B
MSGKDNNYQHDKKLCDSFFGELLLKSELIYNELEEQSIYWNDDLDFVISMVLKTLRRFRSFSDSTQSLLSLYKDEEDQEFTKDLFRKVILKHEENRKVIAVKVTLNEYIELSKYYSTKRSSNFINGILDRITKDFKENGKIIKAGRGLLEG